MSRIITVSAVVIRDRSGKVLTVRKRTSDKYMFPGGKAEAGESAIQTAIREAEEEIGVSLNKSELTAIGEFEAAAANEAGYRVKAHVFEHPYVSVSEPKAEIAQLRWDDPKQDSPDLAPLLRYQVFPTISGRRQLKRLAVFTGSASGASPEYALAAAKFTKAIVNAGINLVYGGGKVGLMGVIADAALQNGGKVYGVIPESLVSGEIAHPGLSELEVVPDMHTRKKRMAELADGFVALPGGAGTLEELFEVWTWQQLGIHQKPVALLNAAGFWNPLLKMLDEMTTQGFISTKFRETLIVAEDTETLLQKMISWEAPSPKWRK